MKRESKNLSNLLTLFLALGLLAYLIILFISPKLNQDFIIILGSRLIGDRVPALLAKRVDKDIDFYNKQAKIRKPPKIIFSGGQGSD